MRRSTLGSFAVTFCALVIAWCALLDVISMTQKPKPKPPVCKICHCGQTVCQRRCGEEDICMLHCEKVCRKEIDEDAPTQGR